MSLLYGTKVINGKRPTGNVLPKCCPDCQQDLYEFYVRTWVHLYQIPIFPIDIVDVFYRCTGCQRTFSKAIREYYYHNFVRKR